MSYIKAKEAFEALNKIEREWEGLRLKTGNIAIIVSLVSLVLFILWGYIFAKNITILMILTALTIVCALFVRNAILIKANAEFTQRIDEIRTRFKE